MTCPHCKGTGSVYCTKKQCHEGCPIPGQRGHDKSEMGYYRVDCVCQQPATYTCYYCSTPTEDPHPDPWGEDICPTCCLTTEGTVCFAYYHHHDPERIRDPA